MTSTIGVMQFVVQLAQEMMLGAPCADVRAMHDGLHLPALRRRRQEDEPRARLDVLLQILAPLERAGALEHELDAELLPRQFQRVAIPQRPQLAAGDDEMASFDDHGFRVAAVHGVEAKQVGEVLDVDQVVDGDQLELRLVDDQLQDRTSDSSQTVDGDLGAHITYLPIAGRAFSASPATRGVPSNVELPSKSKAAPIFQRRRILTLIHRRDRWTPHS